MLRTSRRDVIRDYRAQNVLGEEHFNKRLLICCGYRIIFSGYFVHLYCHPPRGGVDASELEERYRPYYERHPPRGGVDASTVRRAILNESDSHPPRGGVDASQDV